MISRALEDQDYKQIKSVWETCFGDSEAFIDAYFTYAAKPADGRGTFADGQLVSDLFMLDFNACVAGDCYDTKFLAGCATLPAARKKDLMRDLVKRALLEMKAGGYAVTYLHPFLHAFYRKFGYETIAYVTRHTAVGKAGKKLQPVKHMQTIQEAPISNMEHAYARYVEQYDNYFIRSSARFDAWLHLLFADGGSALVLEDGDETAYALYYTNSRGERDIFELVYFNAEQLECLLHSDYVGISNYFLSTGSGEEFTMMRVLDPETVLRKYRFANNDTFTISIEDAFLHTDYAFVVSPGSKHVVESAAKQSCFDIKTDVAAFAAMVCGAKESVQGTPFGKKNSCFFETY